MIEPVCLSVEGHFKFTGGEVPDESVNIRPRLTRSNLATELSDETGANLYLGSTIAHLIMIILFGYLASCTVDHSHWPPWKGIRLLR